MPRTRRDDAAYPLGVGPLTTIAHALAIPKHYFSTTRS